VAPRRRTLSDAEKTLLLAAAHGHWAGGAIRWMLTTGDDRETVCALRWGDLDGIGDAHPMAAEMRVRREQAVAVAARLGRDIATMPVFPNFQGRVMNPKTFADLVRDLIRKQNGEAGGAE
jgi:integrase